MNVIVLTDVYKAGQKDILDKVEQYILDCIKEWNELGDRKYETPNTQVYNHLRACMDDLENLREELSLF